ncbi:MAG TPA: phospho-sugar mutase [Clostridia bacterium]|nr:phospho-sugar mutase [Clostridia bacterium]
MTSQEKYGEWLRKYPDMAQELAAIADDAREIEDRFYTTLSFGTAGMRGVLGAGENRMNCVIIRRATRALADTILETPGGRSRPVVIAYDSRRMSDVFAKETALTLAACGVKALLFPSLRPVPVLSFAVRHLKAIAGVVITASHNPPAYNGYKVYWEDGAQLPPAQADGIQAKMRTVPETLPMDEARAREAGLLADVPASVDDAYCDRVAGLSIQPDMLRAHGKELTIVYSPLHGSGNLPVRRVLRQVGIENLLVVPEQELPDPNFSTVRVPNPEERDAMRLAVTLADKHGADVAFATDPDCDRLGVAAREPSGDYRILTGNQIGCLLLYYILSQRQAQGTLPKDGVTVKSIVSTEMARAIASSFGVETRDVLTGFKFIAEQIQDMEERGGSFLFGFEESYGFLSSTFVRDKDAVNASLLVAELALWLKRCGKTLHGLLQELYARYGAYADAVRSIALPGKDGLEKMRSLMAALRENPPKALAGLEILAVRDYQTGLRTDARGGAPMGMTASDVLYYEMQGGPWVCVRPSGTEPKIKVYVNACAPEMEQAQDLAGRLMEAMAALLS